MKRSKKTVLLSLISVIVVCAAVFSSGCGSVNENTATDTTNPADTGAAPSDNTGSADETASAPSASGPSAQDQVYSILDQDPLVFNGILPKQLDDRSGIDKALPVAQRGGLTIGWSGASLGTDFFTQMKLAAEARCQAYGYTYVYQNADSDVATQTENVDAFISQQVDAIVINCVDLPSMLPEMKKAVDQGIPVICCGNQACDPSYPCITMQNSGAYKPGWLAGAYSADQMFQAGEKLTVGFVVDPLGTSDTESRANGFIGGFLYESHKISGNPYPSQWDAMLAGYNVWEKFKNDGKYDDASDNINFIGMSQSGTPDAPGGQKAAAELFKAHPDIQLLYAEDREMVTGIEITLKQYNLTLGKNLQIACAADGVKDGIADVQSGKILFDCYNSPDAVSDGIIGLIHSIFEENFDANNLTATTYLNSIPISKETIGKLDELAANALPITAIPDYNASMSNNADPIQ